MSPILQDAIIRLVRVVVAAGLVALADSLQNVDFSLGLTGVLSFLGAAVLTAAIHAAMEFLRTYFGAQAVTAKAKAGALRLRGKTFWDWLPI